MDYKDFSSLLSHLTSDSGDGILRFEAGGLRWRPTTAAGRWPTPASSAAGYTEKG